MGIKCLVIRQEKESRVSDPSITFRKGLVRTNARNVGILLGTRLNLFRES